MQFGGKIADGFFLDVVQVKAVGQCAEQKQVWFEFMDYGDPSERTGNTIGHEPIDLLPPVDHHQVLAAVCRYPEPSFFVDV